MGYCLWPYCLCIGYVDVLFNLIRYVDVLFNPTLVTLMSYLTRLWLLCCPI